MILYNVHSLSTFENYFHCQKNKEPVPQELSREPIRPRSPKTQACSSIFYVESKDISWHLVSHYNSLTSCCSYFDYLTDLGHNS